MEEIATFYRSTLIDTLHLRFLGMAEEFDMNDKKIRSIKYDDLGYVKTVIFYDDSENVSLSLARSNSWEVIEGDKKVYNKKRLKEIYTSLNNCLLNQSSFSTSRFIRINDYPEIRSIITPKSSYDPNSNAFQVVEEPAYFPGGMQTLAEFLGLFLRYPEEARANNVSGVVKVQFKVNPNGTTSNFKIIESVGYGCDEEAIRALRLLPDWIPGYQRGVAVETTKVLPIAFN